MSCLSRSAGYLVASLAVIYAGPLTGQAAESRRPADVLLERLRAESLMTGRQFQTAEAIYQRLTKWEPEDGRLWLGLGKSAAGLGHWSLAIESYRRALALGFGARAERAYEIARLFARLDAPDSAFAWIGRALAARYEHRPSIGTDSAFHRYADNPTFRRLAGMLPTGSLSRGDGWRFDVTMLSTEAKRMATGPSPVALTPSFDSAVATVLTRVDSVSDAQMYVELQRLMAMLGNGHSILFPLPTRLVTLGQIPIDLYCFSDGLFVVGGTGPGAELVGAKVERIGDLAAEEALEKIAPLVTRDNSMGLRWNGPYFLTLPFLVQAMGIDRVADSNGIRLELRGRDGTVRTVALRGGEIREPAKLVAPTGSPGTPPLYLQHPDVPQWLQVLPDVGAIYVQYNQVVDGKDVSIAAFADTLLATARRRRTHSLIIDARRNNGGHGSLNGPLVRALVRFEGAGPQNRIFVIVGRNTFSAAGNFLNAVERMTDAVVVGEPASARPNSVGEDTEMLLPYSGYAGSMASRYFQDSDPLDERDWIPPDIPVRLSSADYFGNQDPVLDAVRGFLRASKQQPLNRVVGGRR